MFQRTPLTPDHTLFFLHVPKTGGLTLRRLLSSLYPDEQVCPFHNKWGDLATVYDVDDEAVQQHRLVQGHYHYSAHQRLRRPLRTMIFLRDPVRRSISHYRHFRRWPETDFHREVYQVPLSDFLDNPDYRTEIVNVSLRQLSNDTYDLELALHHLEQFDFIGLTEQFNASMAMLSYQFGLPPLLNYEKINVAPRQADPISDTLYDRLRELNSADYAIYNRAMELFQARYAGFMMQLLEQDYRQTGYFLSGQPQNSQPGDFDLARPLPESTGWYPYAAEAQIPHRWTGPSETALLYLNLGSQSCNLTFEIVNFPEPEILDSLQVTLNDVLVDVHQEHIGGNTYQYEARLNSTEGNKPELSTLKFKVSHTAPAGDSGRDLGLCFSWIRFTPVEAS